MEVKLHSVSRESDIGHARNEVTSLAQRMGFDRQAVGELGIVATELATNLVRHLTVNGTMTVAEIRDAHGSGLEIVSTDDGPGIQDLKSALRDFHSTMGTMGCGLGAVRRLSDEFGVISRGLHQGAIRPVRRPVAQGTVVVARKWLGFGPHEGRFAYSAHSRPYPGTTANGDCFLISKRRDGLLVAVADGLGHGDEAEVAGRMAVEYVELNARIDFVALIGDLHEVLRGTRGVALTLLHLDPHDRVLLHAGIGNVEARLWPRGQTGLMPRPGVIGAGGPLRPRETRLHWPAGGIVIVHTDGISRRWDLSENPELLERDAAGIGQTLMHSYAKPNDDATVVVVREATC